MPERFYDPETIRRNVRSAPHLGVTVELGRLGAARGGPTVLLRDARTHADARALLATMARSLHLLRGAEGEPGAVAALLCHLGHVAHLRPELTHRRSKRHVTGICPPSVGIASLYPEPVIYRFGADGDLEDVRGPGAPATDGDLRRYAADAGLDIDVAKLRGFWELGVLVWGDSSFRSGHRKVVPCADLT